MKELERMKDELESTDRAFYCFLKGRALNAVSKFDEKALQALSKSVKLNPQLTQAWNQLGECFWKKNDLNAALNCFEGAIKHQINKISLRNASMVMRQIGSNNDERLENLMKSLEKAKEAVKCDVDDGISWYILGNAYLTVFFNSKNYNESILKACRVSYEKAKRDEVAFSQPDFLFNYASLLLYEENYLDALQCLKRASLLDFDWDEPKKNKKSLLSYLRDTNDMIAKKGSLKPRRIQTFINNLKADSKNPLYQDKKLLTINELSSDSNQDSESILLAKIIGCINSDKMMAHTFCIMDCDQSCIALMVYNLGFDRGPKLGDTIMVPNPTKRLIDVSFEDNNYKYASIKVENPLTLFINHKKLNEAHVARPIINNKLRND